ncbi:hypothetical protein ACHAWF_002493 [Thalassiosira exigua]
MLIPRLTRPAAALASLVFSLASSGGRCCSDAFAFPSPPASWTSGLTHAAEHLLSPPLQVAPLEELANVRIPGPEGSGAEILAYEALPPSGKSGGTEEPLPSLIVIHEFFGLNPSIVEKAEALSEELGCRVVAPDTFRGDVTDFVPKAIWLALTTPQERVNDDLDAVMSYVEAQGGDGGAGKVAVMGFCYGGGKAIRYTARRRQDAATVVFYGSPLTDVRELGRLAAPVCGAFGSKDAQFPKRLLDEFRSALDEAGVDSDVRVYGGVGHAFWSGMDQIRRGDRPQVEAYGQCTSFLRDFFFGAP